MLVLVERVWFEECVFQAAPPPGGWSKANLGTRPAVIMRGEPSPPGALATNNVGQVYLVKFSKTQFNYGGVRYEQNNPRPGPPIGFWEFTTVSQEDSFTPLLEIVGNTTLPCDEKHGTAVVKFAQVSVQGYMNADSGASPAPVIRMNLTNASLDGVTLFGIGDVPSAIEVAAGVLGSVNLLDARASGAIDSTTKRAVGVVMAKSAGGVALVGYDPHCEPKSPGCHRTRGYNDSDLRPTSGYSGAARELMAA
jgi:hypothetical protein